MSVPADQMSAVLAPFVLTLGEYDLGPGSGGVHRGLPSTRVTITIPEEDPLEIAWVDDPGSGARLRAVVAGLHLGAAELRQRGCTRGVWLTLNPLGAAALLGVPAAALAGSIADLTDVVPALSTLPERLASCRSWPQRRALVERALLAGLARNSARADQGELRATLAALSRTTRVQEAARLLGRSRRHLSGTVRSELGVTAKEYQRLVRFETARSRLVTAAASGRPGLAAVAAASGFADQAHLTREWRTMTGHTPAEWLRTEVLTTRSQTFKTPPPPAPTMAT